MCEALFEGRVVDSDPHLALPSLQLCGGGLHWLRAEKKPAASGRGAASTCGTDTGLSSLPSQNQRKVVMSGWKPEAWAIMVTTPGERKPSVMMHLHCLHYFNVCTVFHTAPPSSFDSENWINETSGGATKPKKHQHWLVNMMKWNRLKHASYFMLKENKNIETGTSRCNQ